MLFLLDKIVKNKTEYIYEKIFNLIKNYYTENLNEGFIKNILDDNKNKIIFHNIDCKMNKYNITSLLIYHKVYYKGINRYYILLLGTHKDVRNIGYGKLLLDEFIIFLKNKDSNKNKIIYLNSINESINFYINYGFCKSNENIINNLFFNYEPYNKKNNYNILSLKI
jgi:hypothetical protein